MDSPLPVNTLLNKNYFTVDKSKALYYTHTMKIVTVSSKGQITIPQDILKNILDIGYGSKVVLYPGKDTLIIKPLTHSISEQTAGSLKKFVDLKLLNTPFDKVRKVTQNLVAEELAKKHE